MATKKIYELPAGPSTLPATAELEFQTTGNGASFKSTVQKILDLVPPSSGGGGGSGINWGVYNVKDPAFAGGAVGNGVANDAPAIQACINAVAVNGGTVYFPRGTYRILATLNVVNRAYITFMGESTAAQVNQVGGTGNFNNGPSTIVMDSGNTPGWTINTPVFLLTTDFVATGSNQWGGFHFEKLFIRPYAYNYDAAYSGHGIVFKKKKFANSGGSVNNGNIDTFSGFNTIRDCTITGANCAILFDDSWSDTVTTTASSNGSGFGWTTIDNCHITTNRWGLYANCNMNIVRVVLGSFMQNSWLPSGATTFTGMTGGAIRLVSGDGLLVQGVDLEGCQVGLYTGMSGVRVDTCWFEGMHDAAMVLTGCVNALLTNNTCSDTVASKTVYLWNTERVTLQSGRFDNYGSVNTSMHLHLGMWNRDVVTDTPEQTEFSMSETYSKTATGQGFVIQTMDVYGRQPEAANAHFLTSSSQVAQTTTTPVSVQGPGVSPRRKCVNVSSTVGNAGFEAQYGVSAPLLSEDDWVVTTVLVKPAVTNTSNSQLYIKIIDDANGAAGTAATQRMDHVFTYDRIRLHEWVAFQWHRKKIGAGTHRTQIYVTVGVPNSSQNLTFGGMAQSMSSQPLHRPQCIEIFNPADLTDHYLYDGRNYYGPAAPTWGTWLWAVGDKIYDNTPSAGGNIGWVCTTAGAVGTCVWKQFGVIEA